jgi:CBS-domain-containing membrane protein
MVEQERFETVKQAVTLFGSDTVVSALAVMQSVDAITLPVVDDAQGGYLGEVSQRELVVLAQRLPLETLRDIVAARAEHRREERAVGTGRVQFADPSKYAVAAARRWRQ